MNDPYSLLSVYFCPMCVTSFSENGNSFRCLFENPSTAFYKDFIAMTTFPEYARCEILAIPSKYDISPLGLALQKNSPYLPLFNYHLNKMKQKGILEQILSKYEPPAQKCPDSSGLPLGFGSCFTAFLALLGGASVGLAIFIVEVISRAMCKYNFIFGNV